MNISAVFMSIDTHNGNMTYASHFKSLAYMLVMIKKDLPWLDDTKRKN